MMAFGFGGLMMLIVIGLPTLVIILVLLGASGLLQNRAQSTVIPQGQPSVYTPAPSSASANSNTARFCSHCGAGLQPDWTHCPQCGAPVQ